MKCGWCEQEREEGRYEPEMKVFFCKVCLDNWENAAKSIDKTTLI